MQPFPKILTVSSYKFSRYRDLLQLTATSATYFYVNPQIHEAKEAYTMFKEKYSLNQPLQVMRYPYTYLEQENTCNMKTYLLFCNKIQTLSKVLDLRARLH